MKTLRILIVGLVLLGTGVLMPRYTLAQQRAASQPEQETQGATDELRRRAIVDRDRTESDDSAQGGGGVNIQVIATSDERTNSVVVRGPAEVLDLVAEVLAALDDTTTQVAGVKIFQ